MRLQILIVLLMVVSVSAVKAQTFSQGGYPGNANHGAFLNNFYLNDSSSIQKWSFAKYSAISTSFSFFRGGNATIVSAPIGLQLNRRLNNNLYAFAGVSLAPAYVNFNRSFTDNGFGKANSNSNYLNAGGLGLYSRAELGLQYINDERTFSISGSIGVGRSSYPGFPYGQTNRFGSNQFISPSR
ncbi:MAG: hypothetical protein WKF89_05620 [Chitinophagaceae bacterium]